MKNIIYAISMVCFLNSYGQQKGKIDLQCEHLPAKMLAAAKGASFVVESSFSQIELKTKETRNGNFTEISIPGTYFSCKTGTPKLPQVKKIIEIPHGATVRIKILDYETEEYALEDYGFYDKVIPVQPSLSKKEQTDTVKFAYNRKSYSQSAFDKRPLVEVHEVGQMRSSRLGRLIISPVRYHPGENRIKVYKRIRLAVTFEESDVESTGPLSQATDSPFFKKINSLTNPKSEAQEEQGTQYPVKYAIVSDRMFESTLQPFIKWKTRKGFNVVTAYTDEIGYTATEIKEYLQALYEAGTPTDPAPTFVLLVGDVAQVPSFDTRLSGSTHVTDLYYGEYTGDNIPEVYYGRFSANSVEELNPQVDKTLEYEQYKMPSPGYLDNVVLVAGVDPEWASKYGNGQVNYSKDYYFNNEHGFNTMAHMYPESGTQAEQIRNEIGKGCGFVNYTAHCDYYGWENPSFRIADIPELGNAHKYPLVIANCCQSNRFNENCFGEEMLRAENKGAVGYIGASDDSYWDEDFYFGVGAGKVSANPLYEETGAGVYDCVFHENGEEENKWAVTNGQVIMAGNLAVTERGSAAIDYYWEIYHLMGDPSVMNYFGKPSANSVSYLPSIQTGTSTLTVEAEEHSYVAMSANGELLAAGYSGNSKEVTLKFSEIGLPGLAEVIVTKQNRIPYFGNIKIEGNALSPVAGFESNITTVQEAGTVMFQNKSSRSPETFEWFFEGGTPAKSTNKNPTVEYFREGKYKVTLIASNIAGNDTIKKAGYITVKPPVVPKADFSTSNAIIAKGGTVKFMDRSINKPTHWKWSFEGGEPETSNGQNPVVKYNAPGVYRVSLSVSNRAGEDKKVKEGFVTVESAQYCESKGRDAAYEWISRVQFGPYEKESGSSSYSNFKMDTVRLFTGLNPVTLTPDFNVDKYNEYWRIWIDYNVDGDFEDDGELVFDSGELSDTVVEGGISIPNDWVGGITTMRISMKNDGPPGSCEEFDYGEVEDYTVRIFEGDKQAPSIPENLTVRNVSERSVELLWDASTDNIGIKGYLIFQDNELISKTGETNYKVTGLRTGTRYVFYVKAADAAGNLSEESRPLKVETNKADLYCHSGGMQTKQGWIVSVKVGEYMKKSGAIGYEDFTLDKIRLETGKTDIVLTSGSGDNVSAKYWKIWIDLNTDGDFEDENELLFEAVSNKSNVVNGKIEIPGEAKSVVSRMRISMKNNREQKVCEEFYDGEVEDYTVEIIEGKSVDGVAETVTHKKPGVYPNPVNDILNINIDRFEGELHVKIYDLTGAAAIEKKLEEGNSKIKVTGLVKGVYFIKIKSTKEESVFKFIKK